MSDIIPPEIKNHETFKFIVARLERHLALLDASLARSEARQSDPYAATLEEIEENADVDIMFLEPRSVFDSCAIGFDPWQSRIIYSEHRCVAAVQISQGLSEEDALEHCSANIFTMTALPGGPVISTSIY